MTARISIKFRNSSSTDRAPGRAQRGVTIIQALLALVVGAILGAVGLNMYVDAQRKVRLEAAQSDISTMISEAQKLYGSTNQYGALTTAIAVRSGVVPSRLRVAGTTTAQNRYNGPITFGPATVTTTNDSAVMVYGQVNKEDCQALVMGSSALSRRIAVASTEVKPADQQTNIAALATACDAEDFVDLSFTFGRGQ